MAFIEATISGMNEEYAAGRQTGLLVSVQILDDEEDNYLFTTCDVRGAKLDLLNRKTPAEQRAAILSTVKQHVKDHLEKRAAEKAAGNPRQGPVMLTPAEIVNRLGGNLIDTLD